MLYVLFSGFFGQHYICGIHLPVAIVCSFSKCKVFHCITTSSFYPLYCRWTLGCFQFGARMNSAAMHVVYVFPWTYEHISQLALYLGGKWMSHKGGSLRSAKYLVFQRAPLSGAWTPHGPQSLLIPGIFYFVFIFTAWWVYIVTSFWFWFPFFWWLMKLSTF